MAKNNRKLYISVFSLLSFALPYAALALGQVTKPIYIENGRRGEEFQDILSIVNNDKEDIEVALSTEGQIAGWAKFYKPGDLNNAVETAPIAALGNADIVVRFAIPEDAPNGTYGGVVAVTKKPKALEGNEGSAVSISQRVDREVTIIVSDKEIVKAAVQVIPEKYDLAKNEPLKITIVYENQGNIRLTPQVQLKIKKEDASVFNAIYPYPETEPAVKPLSRHKIAALEIPTGGLAEGGYFAETIFSQGTQKLSENKFRFSIGETAAGSVLGAAAKNGSDSGFKINWLVIGLAAAVVLFAALFKFAKVGGKAEKFPPLQ